MVNIVVVIADGSTETTMDLSSYGFTATPNVYPVATEPIGGECWVTGVSAAAFTLHVSNAPVGETFTFNCFVFADTDLGTVIYGGVAVVKRLCSIDQIDTFADLDITAFLNIAAYLIDDLLKNYESTLPLSPVPDMITVIADYFAAGIYMQRAKPDEPIHPYTTTAEQKLAEYIKKEYLSTASLFAVGEADSE